MNYGDLISLMELGEVFGLTVGPVQSLVADGVKAYVSDHALTLVRDGKPVASAVVKGSAIKLALAGNLGAVSKNMVKVLVGGAVDSACKALFSPGKESAPVYVAPLKPELISEPPPKVVGEPALTKEALMSMSPVALKDAKLLYQPVHGTSSGSVYFVVALKSDLKIAARIKNVSQVSIRAEGNIEKYGAKLEAMGMTKNVSQGYYSMHLKPDSAEVATRCVGAVLMGLGVKFDFVATRISSFVGKGA
jgi:hypothetical protein